MCGLLFQRLLLFLVVSRSRFLWKRENWVKKIEREIKTTLLGESDHLCAVSHWDGCWMSSMEIGWTPWPIEPLIIGWQLELKGSFTSKAAVIFFGHLLPLLNWCRRKLLLFLCQLFEGELAYKTNRESVWLTVVAVTFNFSSRSKSHFLLRRLMVMVMVVIPSTADWLSPCMQLIGPKQKPSKASVMLLNRLPLWRWISQIGHPNYDSRTPSYVSQSVSLFSVKSSCWKL